MEVGSPPHVDPQLQLAWAGGLAPGGLEAATSGGAEGWRSRLTEGHEMPDAVPRRRRRSDADGQGAGVQAARFEQQAGAQRLCQGRGAAGSEAVPRDRGEAEHPAHEAVRLWVGRGHQDALLLERTRQLRRHGGQRRPRLVAELDKELVLRGQAS